jgi:hypothetical protein
MTDHPRVGAVTRLAGWFIVAMLPVAVFTTSGAPWKWGFALTYGVTAFLLHALVRLKSAALERFVHIVVLSGSAPIAVRFYFDSMDLGAFGVLHVGAVLVISIGAGYLLADQVRLQFRTPSAV